MSVQKNSYYTKSSEIFSEYSLATVRDCNGKTPFQLLGQSSKDEMMYSFWETCFLGDFQRYSILMLYGVSIIIYPSFYFIIIIILFFVFLIYFAGLKQRCT